MKVVPASVGAARALVASAARLTVDYDDKAASTSAPCSLGPTTHLVQMTDTHAAAVVFGVLMTKYTGELDVVLALPQAKTLLSVAKVLAAPSPSFAGAVQRAGGCRCGQPGGGDQSPWVATNGLTGPIANIYRESRIPTPPKIK